MNLHVVGKSNDGASAIPPKHRRILFREFAIGKFSKVRGCY